MNNVIGLDLSLARTGICADGICDSFAAPTAKQEPSLYRRTIAVRNWLRDWLPETWSLVVVEDIGTRFTQTAITMAYLHCQLDGIVDNTETAVVRVSPAQVKRYATGRGNADKDAMMLAAIRAGAPAENNDEVDAWWMWALGKHITGLPMVDLTAYRANVVARIGYDVEMVA